MTASWVVHSKSLTICSKLYQSWRHLKVSGYRHAPVDGLPIQATYLDARSPGWSESADDDQLTILALHGSPATYQSFDPITRRLTSHSVGSGLPPIRMIVPNFPPFTLYEESGRIFRHTTAERANFMRTLLDSIGIQQVDLLIGHSGAVYTTLRLLDSSGAGLFDVPRPLVTRSLALFNPAPSSWQGCRIPRWLMASLKHSYASRLSTAMARKLNPIWLPAFGFKCDPRQPDDPVFTSFVGIGSQQDLLKKEIDQHVRRLNLPCLLVYSGRDNLFTRDGYEEIEDLMGIPRDARHVYDAHHQRTAAANHRVRESVYFPAGGHWIYAKEPDIVTQHVVRLLKSLRYR